VSVELFNGRLNSSRANGTELFSLKIGIVNYPVSMLVEISATETVVKSINLNSNAKAAAAAEF
jgi:hypothetical protein